MNLFWDHQTETDGQLVICKPQCNPAIVRGPRFLDCADRVTWWGLFDVSESIYASAITSVHRNLLPWKMRRETGGGWTGKHRYLIRLVD
jgi:hypothetical protein